MRFQSLLKKSFTFFLFFILISLVLISINFVPNSLNISNIAKGQLSSSSGWNELANFTFSGTISAGQQLYFSFNYSNYASSVNNMTSWAFSDVNGNPMYAYIEWANTQTEYVNVWINMTSSYSGTFNILLWSCGSGNSGYIFFSEYMFYNYGLWTGSNHNEVFPFYYSPGSYLNSLVGLYGSGYSISSLTVNGNGMDVLNINGPGSVDSANWLASNISYSNQYTMLNIATWNSSFSFSTPSGGSYGIYEDFGFTDVAPSSSTSGFGANWSGLSNRYGISGTQLTSNGQSGSVFTSGPQSWILSVYLNGLTNEIIGLGNYANGYNISGMAYNLGSGSQYYTQSSNLWVGNQYIFFYFFDT
ncbi:MAG: hypothetical protein QXF80_07155 [Thermoplasmatales archaeon]